MIGGYLSSQGINGRANYADAPTETALPVAMQRTDARVERSDGVPPEMTGANHPAMANIGSNWPGLLSYNRFEADDDARILAWVDDDPVLIAGKRGDGRGVAFASGCAPHWGPTEFVD